MVILQENHRQQLLHDHHAVSQRARRLTDKLTDRQMNFLPPAGGWSIGQVFDHLCIANDTYLGRIRGLVGRENTGEAAPDDRQWRPSLMGAFLVNSFRSTRKLPLPRIYRPAASPRPEVVEEFLQRQDEMTQLLDRAGGLDWTRLRTSSPVTALIRINLGDCFTIMVVHAERHLNQVERVRDVAVRGER